MYAAWAAIAAVVVTQLGNVILQTFLASRAEIAAATARTFEHAQAAIQRRHELALRELELNASAFEKLREQRQTAYVDFERRVWKLARAMGVRQPRPEDSMSNLAEDERAQREEVLAETRETLWPVLHLGSPDVVSAATNLVWYLAEYLHDNPRLIEVSNLSTAFDKAVRDELASMVGTRSVGPSAADSPPQASSPSS